MSNYVGQSAESVLPVLSAEFANPQLMFTEHDRKEAQQAIATGNIELDFYVRLISQRNNNDMPSHQATYFLEEWQNRPEPGIYQANH